HVLPVQKILYVLALVLMVLAILTRSERDPRRGLWVGLCALVVGNALVCGLLSDPSSRYQFRVAWLPVFFLPHVLFHLLGHLPRLSRDRLILTPRRNPL